MPEALAWSRGSSEARLLIVDDEPNIRAPLVRALSLQGYSVEEAGSGYEALLMLEHESCDLMVLDMRMPGIDGLEVMHRARQLQPELLIIVLTGYATLENAITALKLDAVDYLRKPASTRKIVEAVTQALEKRTKQLYRADNRNRTLDGPPQPETPPDSEPFSERSSILPCFNLGTQANRFIHVYPLILDCQKRLVTISDNPVQPIELTKGETAILASLMAQPGQALSCQELAYAAWGYDVDEDEAKSIIRPYIFRLRHKLETTPEPLHLIRTVRRRGYCFVPPDTPSSNPQSEPYSNF